MRRKYVLDTYAVIAYLKDERGSQKIKSLLYDAKQEKIEIALNYINFGEIYYITYRESNAPTADIVISMIKRWPIKLIAVDEKFAIIAGRIKAENKISYADAFAAATALDQDATLITGDPEFRSLEDIIDILWL